MPAAAGEPGHGMRSLRSIGMLAAAFVVTCAAMGTASASSFVTLKPMTQKLGPSMIAVGEPAPAAAASAVVKTEAPDIVVLGEPRPQRKDDAPQTASAPPVSRTVAAEPGGDFLSISPSVIAMAEPVAPVAYEEVAAIDAPRHFDPVPMVIRGGIVGDAYGSAGEQQAYAKAAREGTPAQPAAKAGSGASAPASPAPDEPQQPDLGPPPGLGKPR